jgi:uncharacterized protein YjbI with pentapeptide repeats
MVCELQLVQMPKYLHQYEYGCHYEIAQKRCYFHIVISKPRENSFMKSGSIRFVQFLFLLVGITACSANETNASRDSIANSVPSSECDPPSKLDCANVDFAGFDFESMDLKGANFQGADFKSVASLQDANLYGANFTDADLSFVNLIGAGLDGAVFRDATLVGTEFSKAQLKDADFTGANLTGAIFGKHSYDFEIIDAADVSRAVFKGANLTKARLFELIVTEDQFSEAILSGAEMPDGSIHD